MEYLLAYDLGTSGNKASLYSTEGILVKSVTYNYDTNYHNQNMAEQNVDDWWKSVCQTTKEIINSVDNNNIVAVSFSGQMQGCVCVDKFGKALRPAIIWADQRAVEQNKKILSCISQKDFYKLTGHRASQSYTMQKVMWIKDNENDVYKKTYKILNCKDYIILKLTGKFATDYTDASGTNLLDINALKWSEELLEYSEISSDKLPDILNSTDIVGFVTKSASVECGLKEGIPVVVGAGDGVCATVGAGCVDIGDTYSCIGTSAWIATTTTQPIYDEDMKTFNFVHMIPGLFSPCGTMQSGGATYKWMKQLILDITKNCNYNNFSNINEYIEQSIQKSPAGSNSLIFLPYLLGERSPRWNANAKGCMLGLTLEHNYNDIIRSTLEGVALNLDIILNSFSKHVPINNISVIGGAVKNLSWLQIMSNTYNLPLYRLKYAEQATSLGAIISCGVGVGVFKDFSVAKKMNICIDKIYPNLDDVKVYKNIKPIYEKAYNSLLEVFEDISNLKKGNL